MSDVHYVKHRVFRETNDVIFYDISVEESNASDLVVHTGAAISPPDDIVGAKQFYIHKHQIDHNRVVSGERTFELVNFKWKYPYHIVHLSRQSGALMIPTYTYHRSVSGDTGSIVIIRQSGMKTLMLSMNLYQYQQQVIINCMKHY